MLPIQQSKSDGGMSGCPLEICIAREADTQDIFRLATAVFGEKQFLYTIYQAPESELYLRRLIADVETDTSIVVAREGSSLRGYYQAVFEQQDAFLSYIASDPCVEGRGIGRSLLLDLEARARRRGCQRIALDVFESNVRAAAWYERLGFKKESRRFLYRVNLEDVRITNDVPLTFDQSKYQQALQEEQERGFSRLECMRADGPVLLGIIAGHTCKVLAYEGGCLNDLIASVALSLSGVRRLLIVATDSQMQPPADCLSSERVLRLHRPVKPSL